jgi:hypothetical protein
MEKNSFLQACPTCKREDWDFFPASFQTYAEAVNDVTGEKLTFIRTNGCSITRQAGIVAMSTMIFVFVAVLLLSKVASYKEKTLDHSQQTTKDYSLQIRNPPSDAKDPREWKEFFDQFGTVVSVTIVLDNQELLLQLLERRKLIAQLEDIVPVDVKVDPSDLDHAFEQALPLSRFSKMLGMLEGPVIRQKIQEIDERVNNDLSRRSYDVSAVFVIFDNENDQQHALDKLQIPLIQIVRQNTGALEKPSYAFRGNRVLNIVDPPEPSNVIWYHLNDTLYDYCRQRTITFFVTVICITLGCAFVVYVKHYKGTIYGALAVSGEFQRSILSSFKIHYLISPRFYLLQLLPRWPRPSVNTSSFMAKRTQRRKVGNCRCSPRSQHFSGLQPPSLRYDSPHSKEH